MTTAQTSLDRLEQLVAKVAERLGTLQAERDRLSDENQELRESLEQADRGDSRAGALEADRADLIERVERLVTGLDDLLKVASTE